jgi:hypothetical protein
MPPDGGELGRLLASVTPREFLSRYWGRRPLYIPGTARKFGELGFDLPSLTKAVDHRVPQGYLEVRFVGRDGRLTAGPSHPEDYRPTEGITLQAFRICDRLERLASFCAGIKIGMSLPGTVTMTGYAGPAGMGLGMFPFHPTSESSWNSRCRRATCCTSRPAPGTRPSRSTFPCRSP